MTRTLLVAALLAAALSATTAALAGPKSPGTSVRPYVSIGAAIVRPSIRPRIRVPSVGRHVAQQVRKRHNDSARTRWTGSWHAGFVTAPPQASANRRKFLSLLGVHLRPAAPSNGTGPVRPPFGSGLGSGVFEPGRADAHDRFANVNASYLLSNRSPSSGGGYNEIMLDDHSGGE